jgi:YbaB/EbfC DNA-binding family
MTVDPSTSLDELVERTRALLAGTSGGEPGPFVGEAAEGMVRCEVGADGRVQTLRVDPKMARQPLEDICRDITTAVNAALDARPQAPSTAPLLAELRQVQEDSVTEMRKITQAMTAALNSATSGGGS